MVAPSDGLSTAPGTGYESGKQNTALQGHVAFFDEDNDGIIWPSDTYVLIRLPEQEIIKSICYSGLRALKFGALLSLFSMIVIHVGFSYVTWDTILPDPFLRLKVNRMHRAKHGSDSEAYTTIGEFDENRFDYIWKMYTSPPHAEMNFSEGIRMVHGNMNPFDLFGWFAAAFEWLATYILLWPANGRMKKDDVRAVYNGSIFYMISGKKPKY